MVIRSRAPMLECGGADDDGESIWTLLSPVFFVVAVRTGRAGRAVHRAGCGQSSGAVSCHHTEYTAMRRWEEETLTRQSSQH